MTNDTPVPAHPVVAIYIEDGLVMVDGSAVEHDGMRPPQQAAIDAVARHVAQPLRRPVRAIATDPSGRTSLVVHPDGQVTDVQSLTPVVAADNPPAPSQPTPQAPQRAQVPQGPQMDEFHRFLTAPSSRRSRRNPSPAFRTRAPHVGLPPRTVPSSATTRRPSRRTPVCAAS